MSITTAIASTSSGRKSCQDCRTRHLKCSHDQTRANSMRHKAAARRPILPRVKSFSTEPAHKRHKLTSSESPCAQFSSRELLLLSDFNRIIAPWFDLFDWNSTFEKELPLLAHRSRMLTCACLAYADLRHASVVRPSGRSVFSIASNHYYKEATAGLAQALASLDPKNPSFTPTILATALVLCGSNMFEDYFQDWKLHLNGISAMLNVARIPQDSFSRSVFWVFVREDTVRSWSQDNAPLLSPDLWPEPEPDSGDCYLANRALKLLSSILNERLTSSKSTTELSINDNLMDHVTTTLMNELVALEGQCDETFITLAEVTTLEKDELPYILKASSRQSSTLQMLHSCRLILASKPTERIHHAIKIIALVAAGLDEPCMLHSVQPIFLAGQQLVKASELSRTILVKFRSFVFGELSRIQSRTGWKTETRKNRLLQVWDSDD